MMFKRSLFIIITGIVLFFLNGCVTTYSIRLVDEETNAPISSVPIELIDENGRDRIAREAVTDNNGEYIIKLADIPGDSFLVSISGDDYFNIYQWIYTPKKSRIKEIVLEKRVTIITGYVLDDSTYNGIPDCEITTMPSITKSASTDKEGKFSIKSDEFAKGVSYTIFASNPPDYIQGTTEVTPFINKRQDLEYPIYLQRTADARGNVELEGEEDLVLPRGIDIPTN